MSTLELPQELIHHIVDCLSSDFPALKLLAQVSRPWSQRTRQHLFQRISLISNIRCITLKELITKRPVLSRYIQEIEIRHEDRYLPPLYNTPSDLFDVLSLLPAITKLCLDGTWKRIEWNSVPAILQDALYDIMKTVTTLELTNISSFQITTLAQCQRLKGLSLVAIYLDPAEFAQPTLPSHSQAPSGRLQRLTAGDCADALKALFALRPFCTIDLFRPTELLVNAFKFGNDMANALNLCGSAVESYHAFALTDCAQNTNPFTDAVFDLSRAPRLKHLYIRLAHYHWWAQYNSTSVLEPAVKGLDGVSSPSDLETVTILFEFAPPPTRLEALIDVDVYFAATREAWSLLDDVLSKDVFGKLHSVLLVFDTPNRSQHCQWPGRWPAKDRLIDKMPKMSAKNVLNVTRQRNSIA